MRTAQLLLFLLFVVGVNSNAQDVPDEIVKEAREFFWGAGDIYKGKTDVPEKWKNESAVILYKNENYDYHKRGKQTTFTVSLRERIKLQDQAAVENYSKLSYKSFFSSTKGREPGSFGNKGSFTAVGVKIVKPDGSEYLVDVDNEAIFEEGKKKLAVSNLSVGDVLDYYFYTVEQFVAYTWQRFDPEENTLAEDYPIIDYKFTLETQKNFYITFKSFNGAPELKEVPSNEKGRRRYELTASNIEKFESERYVYPLVQMPSYKFQNVEVRDSGRKDAFAFLSDSDEIIRTKITDEEVLELYKDTYKIGSYSVPNWLDKMLEGKSDIEKVKTIYYLRRHTFITEPLLPNYTYKNKIISDTFFEKYTPPFQVSISSFIKHFGSVLRYYNIPFDIYVGKNRFDGTIDDALFIENLYKVIKTNTEPPMYFQNYDVFQEINEIPSTMEGTEAFVLHTEDNKIVSISRQMLPVSVPEDNLDHAIFKVSLNTELTGLNFEAKHFAKGHRKEYLQNSLLMYDDVVHEDYQRFNTKAFLDYFNGKKREKVESALNSLVAKDRETQKEWFKTKTKYYLSVDDLEDYSYKIDSTGRFGRNEPIIYEEKFQVKDQYVKKAGANLLIEIGKMMGNQIHITDEERKRTLDVYKEYPVKYITEIHLAIPEGYEIKSMDNLQTQVNNETGSFLSTAEIKDGELIITATEIHLNYFEPVANWLKFVEVLDAAYNLSTQKILLSKM